MTRRFVPILAAAVFGSAAWAQEPAQLSPDASAMRAAMEQRRALMQDPSFRAKMEAVQQARAAKDAAVKAMPDVAALDRQMRSLHEQMRAVAMQRSELMKSKAAELAPYDAAIGQAEAALAAVDPVRKAMAARRAAMEAARAAAGAATP